MAAAIRFEDHSIDRLGITPNLLPRETVLTVETIQPSVGLAFARVWITSDRRPGSRS